MEERQKTTKGIKIRWRKEYKELERQQLKWKISKEEIAICINGVPKEENRTIGYS